MKTLKYNLVITPLLLGALLFPLSFTSAAPSANAGGCTTETKISEYTFACVVSFVTDAINQIVIILFGVALLVFMWGLLKYISAGGDSDKINEARNFILFGLVALFVMVSVWGLVNLLARSFFPTGTRLFIPQIK